MRFLLSFMVSIVCLSLPVQAQDSPVYNGTKSKQKKENTVYNSLSGTARGVSPINIKSITSGVKQSRVRASSNPYDVGGSKRGKYSSMSPEMAREKEARRIARVKQREEREKKRKKELQEKREERASIMKERTNRYTRRFQEQKTEEGQEREQQQQIEEAFVVQKQKRRPIYIKDDGGLSTPQKVFNDY